MGISRLIASDEERKEIAERLRVHSHDFDFSDSDPFWYVSKAAFGDVDVHTYCSVFARLADLIDRPTCKLVEAWDGEREQHYLDCTACHFGRRAIEQDDAGVRYNARELWRNVEYADLAYCPYCGAEVER